MSELIAHPLEYYAFGAYFEPDRYEDHWVCKYWTVDEGRWVMVDAQLDALATKVATTISIN